MNPSPSKTGNRGLTVIDILIVIVTLALLAFLFLPMLTTRGSRMSRTTISCVNNLKQVGLAFRIWATDHNDLMPMGVSTNQGGSKEFGESGAVFKHFMALSNELAVSKILFCPTDQLRSSASNWMSFNNQNLSYFVGLDAVETNAQMFLSGDRHLSTNDVGLPTGLHNLTTQTKMGWTKALHEGKGGNIGIADGSVQQFSPAALQRVWESTGSETNRLAIP